MANKKLTARFWTDHCHRTPALVLYTPACELGVGLSPPLSVLRASYLKQITCVCIVSKPEFMSPSEVYNPNPFYPLASLDCQGRIGHGPGLVTHTTILVASLSLVFSRHAPFVIPCLAMVGMAQLPYPPGSINDLGRNYYHQGG
jgi:hypothetical protein